MINHPDHMTVPLGQWLFDKKFRTSLESRCVWSEEAQDDLVAVKYDTDHTDSRVDSLLGADEAWS